jgi:hypothetical protein
MAIDMYITVRVYDDCYEGRTSCNEHFESTFNSKASFYLFIETTHFPITMGYRKAMKFNYIVQEN